jgi:hypothetical protein
MYRFPFYERLYESCRKLILTMLRFTWRWREF